MKDSSSEESLTLEHYKFTVSYNGTAYYGFQVQGNQKTIQNEIETVLRKLGWKEGSIIGAGRTDTGVHARAQVFSASIEWKHGTKALMAAMNANLPEDISITGIEKAEAGFHARFDAKSRCYHYAVYHSEVRDPLRDPFSWRIPFQPDIDLLNEISKRFIGRHDFKAFGSPPRKDRGTIREVKESFWLKEKDDEAVYVIRANAFLYHMVRRIMFSQIACAQGRIKIEDLDEAIQTGKTIPLGLAPACGLRLWEVEY